MSKTSVFTTITPLPAGVTRSSVIETYHNHLEMIDLNPLVIERNQCKPPNYAPAEEFYSTWYTIKDKVSYLPGNLATGSVSYHACFHDLPDGLQTHVYAPLGLDIRAKWSVGGTLPGEPKEPVELGLGIPREGLYIREDVRMKCNIMMISFVKKTFKESHSKLVDRLVEKAHVIEAKLANERLNSLKNLDPKDRMGHGDIFIAPPPGHTPPTGHGHMRMYSTGSVTASPNLTQESPSSNYSPYNETPQGQSQAFDNQAAQGGYQIYQRQPDYKGDQRGYAEESTRQNERFDPRRQQYQAPPHHGYQAAPVELPSEVPRPQVPPKGKEAPHGFSAELPG